MIAPRVTAPAPRSPEPTRRESREEMIRTAAHLLAERRGFVPGHELDDWLLAEQQIDSWLANRRPPHRFRPR